MSNLALKYSQKSTPKESMFHSSGIANAQNSSSIGTTSTQSFSTRQHIENNRSFIKKYESSQIASEHAHEDNHSKTESIKTSDSSLTSKYKTWYNSEDSGGISSDG